MFGKYRHIETGFPPKLVANVDGTRRTRRRDETIQVIFGSAAGNLHNGIKMKEIEIDGLRGADSARVRLSTLALAGDFCLEIFVAVFFPFMIWVSS